MANQTKGISRRSFLAASGAAAAVSTLPVSLAFASFGPHLEMDDLARFVGSTFKASGAPGPVTFKLVKVEPLGRRQITPPGIRSQGFAATFEAGFSPVPYAEGTYRMRHPDLGAGDLYLKACDENACTGRMEALFN